MAEIQWVDFLRERPGAHLVAATVLPERSPQQLLRLRKLLTQLIRDHGSTGDFATAIVRRTDVAEIHCGFVDRADADRLADVAKARPAPVLDGWASHRAFKLGVTKELALAGALAGAGDSAGRRAVGKLRA